MKIQNALTIDQCKAIAQAEAAGNDFFVFGGKVWADNWEETFHAFKEWADHNAIVDHTDSAVLEFIEETCLEIEYDGSYDQDYMVLTDEEADEKAAEYIAESLWAFNASFLSDVTGFDVSIFEAIQANDKCDGNNEVILQLVGDNLASLVQDAIASDGRGRFLNTYDGDESEFNCFEYTGKNQYLFVYRMN